MSKITTLKKQVCNYNTEYETAGTGTITDIRFKHKIYDNNQHKV